MSQVCIRIDVVPTNCEMIRNQNILYFCGEVKDVKVFSTTQPQNKYTTLIFIVYNYITF